MHGLCCLLTGGNPADAEFSAGAPRLRHHTSKLSCCSLPLQSTITTPMSTPDDISLLEQLEEWLESQVPSNLHELPFRMLETMERVSNELCECLSIAASASHLLMSPLNLTSRNAKHAWSPINFHPFPAVHGQGSGNSTTAAAARALPLGSDQES